MKFISFTSSKGYIYFIIFWVIDLLLALESTIFEKYSQYSGEYEREYILLYLICLNFGEILSGVLVLYTKL